MEYDYLLKNTQKIKIIRKESNDLSIYLESLKKHKIILSVYDKFFNFIESFLIKYSNTITIKNLNNDSLYILITINNKYYPYYLKSYYYVINKENNIIIYHYNLKHFYITGRQIEDE